jgi:hypothetical protein
MIRWIYDNKDIFMAKKVLEMGSGCGLSGIVGNLFIVIFITMILLLKPLYMLIK